MSIFRQFAAASLSVCLAAPAMADYSQVIAFGDSLADVGNLYNLTENLFGVGFPGEPYYQGRFSNGQVSVEYMASSLGLSMTNYAIGGAQTGWGNQGGAMVYGSGVAGQIRNFERYTTAVDANALYFIWAGASDFYSGGNMALSSTAGTAVTNMVSNIQRLYSDGARHFFVPLMPDLGETPSALGRPTVYQDLAASRTTQYNTQLSQGLNALSSLLPDLHITIFDTPAFMAQTIPSLVQSGVNVTNACYDAAHGTVCANPAQYLFWDDVHPTTLGHSLVGQAFAEAARQAGAALPNSSSSVPEPQSWLMAVMGLALVRWATGSARRVKPAGTPMT